MDDINTDNQTDTLGAEENNNIPPATKPEDNESHANQLDVAAGSSTPEPTEPSDNNDPGQIISLQKPTKVGRLKKGGFKKPMLSALTVLVLVAIGITGGYFINHKSSTSNVNNKFCSGVNIVFFPGGTPTDSFASVVYQGAKQAQNDLGPNVKYVWSNWDTTTMTNQFIDAISQTPKPDGIAMMGHPGAQALGPLVDEAESKNIIVTLQNVDIPSVRQNYTNNGFGYVGQDLYSSGQMVSNGVIREYNPAPGTEAIVFGVNPVTEPSRYDRTRGIVDALTSDKLIVHQINLPADVEANPSSAAAKQMFASALSEFPNSKIIVVDHGAVTSAAPAILESLGKKPGQYIVAGFDLSPATVNGIESGYISLVSDQQPYLQGYLPILQICMTKKYDFSGLDINTGTGLIDKSNVNQIKSLVDKKIR